MRELRSEGDPFGKDAKANSSPLMWKRNWKLPEKTPPHSLRKIVLGKAERDTRPSGRLRGSPVETTSGRWRLPSSLTGRGNAAQRVDGRTCGRPGQILAQGHSGSDPGAARHCEAQMAAEMAESSITASNGQETGSRDDGRDRRDVVTGW